MRRLELPYFVVFFITLGLDQASKWYFITQYNLGDCRVIINQVLQFNYIENPGAAFGTFSGSRLFFIIITVILLLILYCYKRELKNKNKLFNLSYALIFSGAIGNLIDRLIKGTVTDFIDFYFWPVFNIADIAICIGVVLLFIYILKHVEK